MSKIRHILFPIDFSPGCHALTPTVRKMMLCWGAQVTLLHVMHPNQSLGRRHELQRLLMQKAALAGDEISSDRICCRLENGLAGDCTVGYARSNEIDLVIVSAGGSTHLYGQPIGDVADQVLTEAPCPVWLDWGSARSRATAGMYARRVGCVLGLSESDEYILSEAAELTEDLEAELTLIHAISPTAGYPLRRLHEARTRAQELMFVRRHIERLRSKVSPWAEVAIDVGSSLSVINRAIQMQQTGLLVTGNWREAILAAEAECPVLRLVTPEPAGAAVEVALPEYPAVMRKSA